MLVPGSLNAWASCWQRVTAPQPVATCAGSTPYRCASAAVSTVAPLSGYRLVPPAVAAIASTTAGSGGNATSLLASLTARGTPISRARSAGLRPGRDAGMGGTAARALTTELLLSAAGRPPVECCLGWHHARSRHRRRRV